MALQIGVEAIEHGDGVWIASILPRELRSLGRSSSAVGMRSVIGVISAEWVDGKLFFRPEDAVVLNAGLSEAALIVALESANGAMTDSQTHQTPEPDLVIQGDDGFRAVANALLPADMASVANDLISEIRTSFPGNLVAGRGRKWVNSPANFVAITIQNRDESLAISVRGEPDRHANTPLDLKRDRPGYSRFKVSNRADIGRAMLIIRHAARLYDEGRAGTLTRRSAQLT
jgi:hypothetical protein